jgi:hypothetical protein
MPRLGPEVTSERISVAPIKLTQIVLTPLSFSNHRVLRSPRRGFSGSWLRSQDLAVPDVDRTGIGADREDLMVGRDVPIVGDVTANGDVVRRKGRLS